MDCSDSTESGAHTVLLVDDHGILYRPGTRRVPHSLTRYPDNPVIKSREKPWEVEIGWNSVYHNPLTGKYQLWYQAYSGSLARNKRKRCVVCYAESKDGIRWVKPSLGLYSYNGIRETNIVLTGNGGHSVNYDCSVVFDPRDPEAGRRYKMAYFDWSHDGGQELPGLSVAFSPDGIHWKKNPNAPLLRASYGTQGDPLPYRDQHGPWTVPLTMSDAIDAIYDPPRGQFAIYGKMWTDGPDGRMYWKHGMGHTESKDFIHWSRPQLLLTPDEFDPPWVEFHHSPVFYYNDCYFALLQILHRAVGGGVINVELAISRNGLEWKRPFREHFFLARSGGLKFDSGSLFINPMPVLLEDDFHFYYAGYSQGATSGNDYGMLSGIGLATMRRDRFAGLRPIERIGQITLKPLSFANLRSITINADASVGSVLPEILDAEGYRIHELAEKDAIPVTGDSLRHPLRWRRRNISEMAPGNYILRLHLKNAEVFAVNLS
ncbi:MAG: hypothetical protein ACRD18_06550 [Terriglobia bacterium]